jgi:hypothetical protein
VRKSQPLPDAIKEKLKERWKVKKGDSVATKSPRKTKELKNPEDVS